MRHRAKFRKDWLKRFRDMPNFRFLKMAAVNHLGFINVVNFHFRSHLEAKFASLYQILRRSVKPFQRYGRFSIFQDGGRPPSWICFTRLGPPTKSIWRSL